jgi:hypothetical protein
MLTAKRSHPGAGLPTGNPNLHAVKMKPIALARNPTDKQGSRGRVRTSGYRELWHLQIKTILDQVVTDDRYISRSNITSTAGQTIKATNRRLLQYQISPKGYLCRYIYKRGDYFAILKSPSKQRKFHSPLSKLHQLFMN